jgi:hypothetical protein
MLKFILLVSISISIINGVIRIVNHSLFSPWFFQKLLNAGIFENDHFSNNNDHGCVIEYYGTSFPTFEYLVKWNTTQYLGKFDDN